MKDAEVVIQRQKTGEGSKMAVRQLRNQLDDAEFSSASAVKAKKTMELELADLQQQLDELFKSKQEVKYVNEKHRKKYLFLEISFIFAQSMYQYYIVCYFICCVKRSAFVPFVENCISLSIKLCLLRLGLPHGTRRYCDHTSHPRSFVSYL